MRIERTVRAIVIGAVASALSGCTLFEHSATCVTRKLVPPETLKVTCETDHPNACNYKGALARWYVPYAIMSLNVYHPDGVDDAGADQKESCSEESFKVRCPKVWDRTRLGTTPRFGFKKDEGRYFERNNDATGLFMESFLREMSDERRAEYVIAFRGTEWNRLSDWRSNLRWFSFSKNDEYPEARSTAIQWVAKACEGFGAAFDRLDITMTGHSLGGGLAQNAGYAVARALAPGWKDASTKYLSDGEMAAQAALARCPQDKIRVRVVAFDPSPVTGYRDEQPLEKCENPLSRSCRTPIIMRLYEKGEVLAPLRRLISWFNPLWPNICEDRFSFGVHGAPIRKHQMRRLAGGLVWTAAAAGDTESDAIYRRYCPQGAETPVDPQTHREPLLDCAQPAFECPAPLGSVQPAN